MKVSFDPAKRKANLVKHGLDLADAAQVLERPTLDLVDDREDYGEVRWVSVGSLRGDVVVCVWAEREEEARMRRPVHPPDEPKSAPHFLAKGEPG